MHGARSCPTLCDPVDCSLPGSSVHGIFRARVLKWVAISFSRGSSRPRSPAFQADALTSEPPGKPTKGLLISWLKSLSTVILEPKKIKSVTVSTFSSSICHEVIGLDLSFLNVEFKASFFSLLFYPHPEAL